MTDPVTTCKAVALAAGGAVAVECADLFLGIPRKVLYAAIAGACAGLAMRGDKAEWEKFLAPNAQGLDYLKVVGRSFLLALKVSANALVCAWIGQLLQFLPLTSEMAKLLPMAVAGVLAWASWTMLPAALESAKAWMARKAGGG